MKNKKNIPMAIILIIILLIVVVAIPNSNATKSSNTVIESLDQLSEQTIGVQTGTAYEEVFADDYPDINIKFFSSFSDQIINLEQGKIDGYVSESVSFASDHFYHPWLQQAEGSLAEIDFAWGIGNNDRAEIILSQLNSFIYESKQNGFFDEMWDYWLANYSPDHTIQNEYVFSGENGVLSIALEAGYEPFSYISNGELAGYDVELMYKFCQEYGYTPKIYEISFDAISPGIETGKYDIGCNLVLTDERTDGFTFSDPYIVSELLIISGENNENANPIDALRNSFYKTFIKENRWKMFAEGIIRTLIITIASIIIGTVLGFLVYLVCKDGNGFYKQMADFISWLVHGTPTVVFLMILYYVIFGNSNIDGMYVSIIAFSVLFTCSMYDMIANGCTAIGKEQYEAARSLGYSSNQAFFKVIFPQSAMHFLPIYKGEIVSLIKETSVVGYIAVQDLTKMSDLVRARTFEALFPLIFTAIIYFILATILTSIVKRFEFSINPKRRKNIKMLSGVKLRE